MVNNGCGATLMFLVINIAPERPKEWCLWFCSKRCIMNKVPAGAEHPPLRGCSWGTALSRDLPTSPCTDRPHRTVQPQPVLRGWSASQHPHGLFSHHPADDGYPPPSLFRHQHGNHHQDQPDITPLLYHGPFPTGVLALKTWPMKILKCLFTE